MTAPLVRLTTALLAVATAAGLAVVLRPPPAPTTVRSPASASGSSTGARARPCRGCVGTSIVEGDRAVAVDADEVQLLGTSGGEYVASIYSAEGSSVERVAADGTRTVVLDRVPFAVALSGDGTRAGHHEAARDASYGRGGARRDHR